MAPRNPKCQWTSWKIGIRSNGTTDTQVEVPSGKRFNAQVEPRWKRSGNGNPRAVRQWVLSLLMYRSTHILLPVNVLDSEKLQVDFKPLYQCIHIYSTLDSIDDLRKSYQADRKVHAMFCFFFQLTQLICRHNQT